MFTFNYNGHKITLNDSTDYAYRSHINGMQCTEPDNWVLAKGFDESGNVYNVWYYVEDPDSTDLDSIDYANPEDVEIIDN